LSARTDWAERASGRTGRGGGATASLPAWLHAAAPELEVVLTRQIGPMAKLLLRKVAQSAPDFDTLAEELLSHIPSPQARAMFGQQVTAIRTRHLPATGTGVLAPAPAATGKAPVPGGTASAPPIDPAEAEALVPLLAAAIGPIAAILVKRALREPCSRAEFVTRLAAHIEAETTRARFLARAGGEG
jgi:serine/threonine-protein kinase